MPTEMDYARLAAFIDGEGMIDIHTHKQFRKHLGRVHVTHYVRIIMTNTDPRLAIWCKNTFEGTANSVPKPTNPNHRQQLKWYCSSKKAIAILERCLPYLILKREQAEVALEFQKTVTRIGRNGHPPEILKKREELQNKMKSLKRMNWPDFSTLVH